MKYDVLIVGAGISGAVLAERLASVDGKKVLVIDKRDHLGGNCYDFADEDGLWRMKYGGHIFHTSDEDVWEYVNKFAEWIPSEHKVLSFVDGKYVPVPVNITTVNMLFGTEIKDEAGMKAWLDEHTEKIADPKNSEEVSLTRVGKDLYEKMFKGYTIKQWDMEPKELDASVMARIPVRTDFNDRYFSDKYEAQPKEGYTKFIERILDQPNNTLKLGTDFDSHKDKLGEFDHIYFSGKIDEYFDYKFGKLGYRSLKFEFSNHDEEHHIPGPTVNYPSLEEDFTRIVEYKYFYRQEGPKTVTSKEWATWEGDPYYPVPTEENQKLYEKYKEAASELKNVTFIGRLGNYKYINMDLAIKDSLDLARSIHGKKS